MNKRSLKSIVISSLLAIIIIITSVQLFLFYELYQTRNGLTKLLDVHFTKFELSENILNNIQSIGTNLRDALLTYKMGNSKEYIGKVEKLRNEIGEIVTKLEPLLTSPAEKDLMEKIKAARSAYIEIQNRIISLLNEGDLEVASNEMANIFPPIYQSYVKAIEDFTAFEEKDFKEDVEEIKHDISILYNTIIYSSIFYIIILIAIAYFTLKAVFKPLGGEPEEVKDILGNVAEGNLSIKIDNPTPDSVMEYTGKMIKELSDVIQRIRASADTISAAAEELNST
ncbi:MAG: MCP four helix bundle domain-containing protein, partial [Deferribacterales bacterium]